MARLGPFEHKPHLVVAVSGGRDSMALVLLAADWVAARDGRIDAVTVDHGLRTESAAEALKVGTWLAAAGIDHYVLSWNSADVTNGVEAAARAARYERLEEFCRARGALHLLVGHHHADQVETREMRRLRASGPAGLAGMAAVRELSHTRILRPLLTFPRDRLTATMTARNQDWIEDPSNQDVRFARARLRSVDMTKPVSDEPDEPSVARVAADLSLARAAARAVTIYPSGYAVIDTGPLSDAPQHVVQHLVGTVVRCIAGRVYPPRGERLSRMSARIAEGALEGGATLAGCVLRPNGPGRVIVLREFAAIAPPTLLGASARLWDERFTVTPSSDLPDDCSLGAVGQFEAPGAGEIRGSEWFAGLSPEIRKTLPAICHNGEIFLCALQKPPESAIDTVFARFSPRMPVAGARFATA
ncbi:MAG: tRNA lysidine(34) synthetase TilS [Alphaproteobacteria bacterium]|nr:tRNA lysidine(34) synthetase TilS [Alphaproteobacteria bacterium]